MSNPKPTQSLNAKILRRIRGRGMGSAATPSEFLDLGTRAAVDQALSRLTRQGILRRVSRGIYAFPKKSRLFGELSPQPEEVAKALARRGAQKLQLSGAFAANLLGLSEQVPARLEYVTDGPSCRVVIRQLPIVLKRTTTRQLATAGRVSGTVAQALRFLRRSQVDGKVIETLRSRLSPEDKQQLIQDVPLVPAWIGEIFHKVAEAA